MTTLVRYSTPKDKNHLSPILCNLITHFGIITSNIFYHNEMVDSNLFNFQSFNTLKFSLYSIYYTKIFSEFIMKPLYLQGFYGIFYILFVINNFFIIIPLTLIFPSNIIIINM